MRVLTVVGARPQFVKAAPVSRALRRTHEERLVHTGQHYDANLSAAFFEELGIPEPDARLEVGSGPAGVRLAAIVAGVRPELATGGFDAVLVYGDTDSTFGGALAARLAGVPLAHVEAGCRSGDLRMPEEVNRIATDHLSALLLCATPAAVRNAERERVSGRVEHCGDVMLDVCLELAGRARSEAPFERYGLVADGYHLATVHRVENTDDARRLASIVATLDSLDRPVLLPCHPRTHAALEAAGRLDGLTGLRVIEPVPYVEMMGLVAGAHAVLTDSGGLQKEALFVGRPCVTLRDSTEWPETVASGWNRLVGADAGRIRAAVEALETTPDPPDLSIYGGGRAAENVVAALERLTA